MLLRFLIDDRGQDLIEYALLSATIGICAVAAWNLIPQAIHDAYVNWDTEIQDISSCTPDPISHGGGGC